CGHLMGVGLYSFQLAKAYRTYIKKFRTVREPIKYFLNRTSRQIHTTGLRTGNLFSSVSFLQKRVLTCGSYLCQAIRSRSHLSRRSLLKCKRDSHPTAAGWHTLQTSRGCIRFMFRASQHQAASGRYPPRAERSHSGVVMVRSCFILLPIESSWQSKLMAPDRASTLAVRNHFSTHL